MSLPAGRIPPLHVITLTLVLPPLNFFVPEINIHPSRIWWRRSISKKPLYDKYIWSMQFHSDEIVALTLIHFIFCYFCNQCSLFSLSKKKKKFKKLCPSLLKLVNLKPTLLGIGSFYKNLFCLRLKHYRVFKFVQRCWILDYGHQVIIVSCKWQGIITFPAWDQRIGDT